MKPYRIALILSIVVVLAGCGAPVEVPQLDYLESAENGFEDIVYIGLDGNVYTVSPSGDATVPVTEEEPDREAFTPNFSLATWAPDGEKIAFMGFSAETVESGDTELRSTLYVADETEQRITTSFSSIDTSPFYLYWSPDSERVSFASSYQDEDLGLTLQVVDVDGSGHSNLVSGRPMYWAWAPDASSIVTHSGTGAAGRIRLVEFRNSRSGEDELSAQPSSFQAPAYSPDGSRIAAAVENPDGDTELAVMPAAGAPVQPVASLRGFAAFGWSPAGNRIAYIDGRNPTMGGIRGELHVIAPDPIPSTVSLQSDGSTRVPGGEGVIAFFWSPDGEKLAFFRPVASTGGPQQIVMTLFVYDIPGREVRAYGTFPASGTFAYQVLPYFDQYQRSATIWSPDSSQIVVSAMADENTPAVFVVDLDGSEPKQVAEGHLAFWRPGADSFARVGYSSNTTD
jgi:TolB protein